MGILSISSATSKVNRYRDVIVEMKKSARNNFEDMDLENNDVRDDIEEIVEYIESRCNSAVGILDGLRFE